MSEFPRIPFNRPTFTGRETEFLAESIGSGQLSGDGIFSVRCAEILREAVGSSKVLLTPSCTHALEMAALLCDIKPGDEVVVPSFTFVSTANAFALRGAKILFADISEKTMNMDPESVRTLLGPRVRAIVPVHYAGVGCPMDELLALAGTVGASVIEDNAHGLFGTLGGKPLGSFGGLSATSFHETKNYSCGEGGALFINDPALVERAEIIREKGTNRQKFFRGQVDKYTWVDIGSSYLLSDALAALLYAQLIERDRIAEKRRMLWERYRDGLGDWAADAGARLPEVPEGCGQSHHMFYLVMDDLEARESLRAHLLSAGILAVFHYVPLDSSPMGLQFGAPPGGCPVTSNMSARLLRLPFFTGMSEAEQARVIDVVTAWRGV